MNRLAPQIEALVRLGVPTLVGQTVRPFQQTLLRLEEFLGPGDPVADLERGIIGAAIVIRAPGLPIAKALNLVDRKGKAVAERLYPRQSGDFTPHLDRPLPQGQAYLLLDVDRGDALRNAAPSDAQQDIRKQRRSPLTLEEGAAVLMLWPLLLQRNRCFMTLGSRCGDRRVPAYWLSGEQPKLGWCWEGNPHTWLGFATCAVRTAGVDFGPQAATGHV